MEAEGSDNKSINDSSKTQQQGNSDSYEEDFTARITREQEEEIHQSMDTEAPTEEPDDPVYDEEQPDTKSASKNDTSQPMELSPVPEREAIPKTAPEQEKKQYQDKNDDTRPSTQQLKNQASGPNKQQFIRNNRNSGQQRGRQYARYQERPRYIQKPNFTHIPGTDRNQSQNNSNITVADFYGTLQISVLLVTLENLTTNLQLWLIAANSEFCFPPDKRDQSKFLNGTSA
eukprot:gb/GEZN01012269.1/.p1 GENE.gb/GEZN01012269.1/~~gb/GEZN01012269.1/.p1  ORF type:complete len:230 (-),score=36.34 gb/GEZN01012269.1/:232-921(-)